MASHSSRAGRGGGARWSRRRLIGAGAGSGMSALFLAACGGSNNSGNKATTGARASASSVVAAGAATGAGSTASPAAAQPRRGGIVTFATGADLANLDVQMSNNTFIVGWGPGAAWSQLVRSKAINHNGIFTPEPDFAEKWEQPDQATYVFTVRSNARFHNIAPVNGRLATADDVKASFERELSLKVNASSLPDIASIDVPDKQTVRIKINAPNVDFLGSLADSPNKVVPHESWELKGDLKEGPVIGTGPWIYKDWQRGVGDSLTRNPQYFEQGIPYADELRFVIVNDLAALEAQVGGGAISFTPARGVGLTTGAAKRLVASGRVNATVRQPDNGQQWVMLNLLRPQWKDQRVRKALSMAIDRQLILTNSYEGEGDEDASGMAIRPDWRLPQDELKKLRPFDPKAAKALLAQAGVKLEKDELLALNGVSTQVAQLVQANFKDIGLDTTIRGVEAVELTGTINNPTQDKYSMYSGSILHSPTITAEFESCYKTNGSRNGAHLSDPKMDQMIQAQKIEFDEGKRKQLVQDLQRYAVDYSAYIGLVGARIYHLYQKNVHNGEVSPGPGNPSVFAYVWFDA